MIGFLLMVVFLLGFVCCSAVESFIIPPSEPDTTKPPPPEARAGVDAFGRVRAYMATGPYYEESLSPPHAIPLGHELADGDALMPAVEVVG
jgi:hypothetical protein